MNFYSCWDPANLRNRENRGITVSSSSKVFPEEGTLGSNWTESWVGPLRRSGCCMLYKKFPSSTENRIPVITQSSYDSELTRQLSNPSHNILLFASSQCMASNSRLDSE